MSLYVAVGTTGVLLLTHHFLPASPVVSRFPSINLVLTCQISLVTCILAKNISTDLQIFHHIAFARAGGQYVHINDVIQAYLLTSLNERAYGQIFNIGGPYRFEELELARFVIRKTNSKSSIEAVSEPANRMISIDISKARKLLKYKPEKGKKDFEQIIEKYIDSRRSAHNNVSVDYEGRDYENSEDNPEELL